jgi:predicted transcriptional regulator
MRVRHIKINYWERFMMKTNISDHWLLRALRKQLGLTQKQLGAAALITQPFISLYENGWQSPSLSERKRLVEALIAFARK